MGTLEELDPSGYTRLEDPVGEPKDIQQDVERGEVTPIVASSDGGDGDGGCADGA